MFEIVPPVPPPATLWFYGNQYGGLSVTATSRDVLSRGDWYFVPILVYL